MESRAGETDGVRDVVIESRTHELVGTDEGWGVWDRTVPSDRAIVVYPPTDEGLELAYAYFQRASRGAALRRGPWLDATRNAAIVSGGVWLVAAVVDHVRFALEGADPVGGPSVTRWLIAVEGIAYSAFLVAVAAYILLWLRAHQRP